MTLIVVLVVLVRAVVFIVRYLRYKNSTYYKVTQKSYRSVFRDKGTYGEYNLYTCLRHFETKGCRFLFNLYVPTGNGRTSEIDIVMIHPKCLFVIECKNYSGWIFGNENNEYWTQVLPKGRWKSHKTQFYNPIRQNAVHIGTIKRHISEKIPIHSVIAFSDRCTFRDVTVRSKVIINHCSYISRNINTAISELDGYTIDVDGIYNNLLQYVNADENTKLMHILNRI